MNKLLKMNKLLVFGIFATLTVYTFAAPIEISKNKTCVLCEDIVGIISKDAHNLNNTITEIIIIVKDICNHIIGPSGKECLFILNNIQEIMKWIVAGFSPSVICTKLGFCNTTNCS